jgi:predicted DNA-binding transcriptional regulator AlpA
MFQEVSSQTLKSARLAMVFLCAHRTGLQMGTIATQLGNLSEDISAELAGRGHQQEAQYLKVSELAPMIGKTTSTVYNDIADGAIEGAVKVGPRTWRIPVSSAEAYVRRRTAGKYRPGHSRATRPPRIPAPVTPGTAPDSRPQDPP